MSHQYETDHALQRKRASRAVIWVSPYRAYALLLWLYAVAWGGTFWSIDGVFWDDWVLVDTPPENIQAMFSANGLPFLGPLHNALLQLGPPAYHMVAWASFLVAGLSLFAILQRVPSFQPWQRFLAAALFLVLPVNAARFAMINVWYALCLASFFVAWFLLVRRTPPRLWDEFLAVVLFGISFVTQSLLVFFLLPLLFLFLRLRSIEWTASRIIRRYGYLVLLPIVFYVVKSALWVPSGPYGGYNSLNPRGLLAGGLLFVLTGLTLIALIRVGLSSNHERGRELDTWKLLFSGIFITWLALVPYMGVGHFPPFSEWATRHYLLTPLGLALTLTAVVSGLRLVTSRRVAVALSTVLLLVSILGSMAISLSYFQDWSKQKRILALLAQDENLSECNVILFRDEALAVNIFGTWYAGYAWNGLLRRASGEGNRMGWRTLEELEQFLAGDYDSILEASNLDYGAQQFAGITGVAQVTIRARNFVHEPINSFTKIGDRLQLHFGIPSLKGFGANNLSWESSCEPRDR